MNNKYYVYEWIRLDTNEPFYVGKGCGDRWRELTRGNNNHFNNIVKSIPTAVNILHDNLDEETAFGLEVWYIREYRDIIGYDLVNINDGGAGCSLYGESNPFYGKHHTEETKQKMINNHANYKGENHPQYGKPKSNSTKDKISISLKNSEKHKMAINKTKKSVMCVTTKRLFTSISEACSFYNISRGMLIKCCKKKRSYCGTSKGVPLVWIYLNYNHNKSYRLNINIRNVKKKECSIKSKFRKIICLNNNEIYNGFAQCGRELGLNRKSISRCCNGKQDFILKNGVKYRFEFYE